MAAPGRVVVPNNASRWSSLVYWLVWLFGVYGVIGTRVLPPARWQGWLAYLGLVLLP